MKHLSLLLSLVILVSLFSGCSSVSSKKEPSARIPTVEKTFTAPTEETPAQETTQPATTAPTTVPAQEPAQPVMSHSDHIAQIRTWYQEIVDNTNLQSTVYGTSATVYRDNGQVVCIEEYRQLDDAMDPAMATIHFYYHDGIPFFIFIEYRNYHYDEVRLYFVDGQLIRWIINDNGPNDNVPSTQWQPYYDEAVRVLNNLPQ